MGKISVDNVIYNCNDELSNKDFTKRILLEKSIPEGAVIFGSCFSHETLDTVVFPDVQDLTLINCNLDNVYLNPLWIIIGCSARRYKVQNDREDWIVDKDDKPKEPIRKEKYIEFGLSIDPKDLPIEPLKENIIEKKQRELGI